MCDGAFPLYFVAGYIHNSIKFAKLFENAQAEVREDDVQEPFITVMVMR